MSLNLCPFAAGPFENNLVRIAVYNNVEDETVLTDVLTSEIDTLVTPEVRDFLFGTAFLIILTNTLSSTTDERPTHL